MSLSVGRVRAASARAIDRHPVLMSVLASDENNPVLLMRGCSVADLTFADVSALDSSLRIPEAGRIASHHVWTPFDLHRGPLFRPMLIRLQRQRHVLGFAMHHLVSDAISCSILLQDLCEFLRPAGAARSKPARHAGYEHYLLGMHEWILGSAGQEALACQTRHIIEGGAGASLRHAQVAEANEDPVDVPLSLDEVLTSRMRRLAMRHGASVFLLLVAIVAIAMERRASDDAVIVGGVITGRENPGFHTAVGYFSDRAYWNVDVSGNPPFSELLQRIRREFAECARHQYVRSDFLLESLRQAGQDFAAPILNFRVATRGTHRRSDRRSSSASRFLLRPLHRIQVRRFRTGFRSSTPAPVFRVMCAQVRAVRVAWRCASTKFSAVLPTTKPPSFRNWENHEQTKNCRFPKADS